MDIFETRPTRTNAIHIRVTDHDKELLELQASRSNLKTAEFIRRCIAFSLANEEAFRKFLKGE